MLPPPFIHAESCEEVFKQLRSNFFKAFVVLPQDQRDALKKVYVMFHIVDDCVDEMPDAISQRQALNVWRHELKLMYQGQAQHAITKELWPVVQKYQIPEEYFQGLADGCEMDIHKKRYATFEELYEYCYRVAGLVGLTCHKIFGYHSATSEQAAIDLGVALQLTNILRDLGEDLKRDRIYLPKAWLEAANYSETDLHDHLKSEEFFDLLRLAITEAENRFQKGMAEFAKDQTNKLKAAKIMAKTYFAILQKIKKDPGNVFNGKVSLSGFEKLKIVLPSWF